ncbi:hypothetical protein CRV01_04190 [Arcobacter sp. CECT 8983]|uniref:hypothetical protein n=1 Tax=Arcobacter sp. CECT 8983 TaxID=2044508 RepID=UPI00100B3DFF|nr:hypothetical protein [Arcobacter sp. CECT 8983]RXJ90364.1 hypothetical protein CRV01_04190 [Arcobacter sp. CECT 8983]
MKKAFTLFSVLILLFIFSILAVKIYETKSISSINIVNKYKYIQAKNHLLFLEEYIKSLSDYNSFKKVTIEDENYSINAYVIEEINSYKIELVVKANEYNIRLQKVIIIQK